MKPPAKPDGLLIKAGDQFGASMLGIPPKGKILSGVLLILTCAAYSVFWYVKGDFDWGGMALSVFGFIAVGVGIGELKMQARFQRQIDAFEARREEILEQVSTTQRAGNSPIRWLMEEGFTEYGVRARILAEADRRSVRQKPRKPE